MSWILRAHQRSVSAAARPWKGTCVAGPWRSRRSCLQRCRQCRQLFEMAMSWRAGIFIRDPRAGPFTRSDTPQSTTFISEALLIAQASTATCFVVPSTVLKKLFASTPIRLPPSHHTSATSPQQCTTIRSRHFLTVAHARFFWNLLDQVGSRKTPHLSPSNPNNTIIMLRRPATTIQLTVADVEQYEANRQRKLWEQQQTQQQDSSQSTIASENAQEQIQSNPLKSRKERIMGGNGRGN
jgi:hypothetical protein